MFSFSSVSAPTTGALRHPFQPASDGAKRAPATGQAENWGRPSGGTDFLLAWTVGGLSCAVLKAPGDGSVPKGEGETGDQPAQGSLVIESAAMIGGGGAKGLANASWLEAGWWRWDRIESGQRWHWAWQKRRLSGYPACRDACQAWVRSTPATVRKIMPAGCAALREGMPRKARPAPLPCANLDQLRAQGQVRASRPSMALGNGQFVVDLSPVIWQWFAHGTLEIQG